MTTSNDPQSETEIPAVSAAFTDAEAAERAAEALRAELDGRVEINVPAETKIEVGADDPLVRHRARQLMRVQGAVETQDPLEDEDGQVQFARGFTSVVPSLRQHLKQLKGSDQNWREMEGRYRYGWQMANRPDYSDREWSDAWAELCADWQRRHPEIPWSEAEPFVKQGWAAARGR